MIAVKQKLGKMAQIEYQLVVHFWQIKILRVLLRPLELQNQYIGKQILQYHICLR